jgi:hypothetical protein
MAMPSNAVPAPESRCHPACRRGRKDDSGKTTAAEKIARNELAAKKSAAQMENDGQGRRFRFRHMPII